jgi:hypothetical protein
MEAFDDAVEKLLWPERRLGRASIYRTSAESWLTLDERYLPPAVFVLLRAQGLVAADQTALRIGPIPKGMPVNLLANIDLEFSFEPERLANWIALVRSAWETFGEIRDRQLTGAAATARLEALVPALRALSKCPDFVTDRGHLFGAQLPDDDKRALIAFLKRL